MEKSPPKSAEFEAPAARWDVELKCMTKIAKALEELEAKERARVIVWTNAKFGETAAAPEIVQTELLPA